MGEVVTAECHRGASVVKPVGFATGNGEGSRRRIRTLIALQNPVALVSVAILRGRGPSATPRQGGDDAHWVCTGLHRRPEAATPTRRAHRRWLREALPREALRHQHDSPGEREAPRVRAQGRCRRGVETRPPRALPPRSYWCGELAPGPRGRITVPPGSHRHDNTRRQANVSHLCRTRRVRARHDP